MAICYQFQNLLRWAMAFIIIYMVLPAFIFPISGDSLLERLFARYICMVAVTIIMGYILAALKLYEVLSVVMVITVFYIFLKFYTANGGGAFKKESAYYTYFFDFLDDPKQFYHMILRKIAQKNAGLKTSIHKYARISVLTQLILIFIVMAFAIYLRFYDTLRHAAPSMSDAYVTLAWMKYIDGRMLFHDGIYPQGFYIYLSILHKFAACDALYVLKYSGSLSGVLTTIGLYLFVVKVTGRKIPGILSAFIFGVLGCLLPLGWERQAAPLPQEFAMTFLFPALYNAILFFQTRKKQYLWVALAAFAVIGLVHSLIFAFLWVGFACLIISYLLNNPKEMYSSAWNLFMVGIVSGIVAIVPVPIALLYGNKFHSASLEFLTRSTINVGIPNITVIDIIALIGLILFLIISIWKRRAFSDIVMNYFIVFFGILAFIMYLSVGVITGNVLLITRMGILWSLLASVSIGVGAEALIQLITEKLNERKLNVIAILTLLLIVSAISYIRPLPAQPYKMQYDAEINQYIRIANQYPPAEWMIVSNEEGYDLALGKGWHTQLSDFLRWYNPTETKLVRIFNGKEVPLQVNDLFIFEQKKLFKVNLKEMEPIMTQRVQNYANLKQWISEYQKTHDNISVFYQDDYIEIYHIQPLKL